MVRAMMVAVAMLFCSCDPAVAQKQSGPSQESKAASSVDYKAIIEGFWKDGEFGDKQYEVLKVGVPGSAADFEKKDKDSGVWMPCSGSGVFVPVRFKSLKAPMPVEIQWLYRIEEKKVVQMIGEWRRKESK